MNTVILRIVILYKKNNEQNNTIYSIEVFLYKFLEYRKPTRKTSLRQQIIREYLEMRLEWKLTELI